MSERSSSMFISIIIPAIFAAAMIFLSLLCACCYRIQQRERQGGFPGIRSDLEVGLPPISDAVKGNAIQTNRTSIDVHTSVGAGNRAKPLSHQMQGRDHNTAKMVIDHAGVNHGNIYAVGGGAGQKNRRDVLSTGYGNRGTPSSHQYHGGGSSSTTQNNQGLDMMAATMMNYNHAAYSGGGVSHSNTHSGGGGGGGGCDSGGGGGGGCDSGGGGGGGCGGC